MDREEVMMRTHTVAGGGGCRLHVEEAGNPEGRPILFIHGFSQCRLSWGRQLQSDLANDFRLVAIDNRGHGLSDKPRDAYGDPKLWADDVRAVITSLDLDRPILSGWSYGGMIICDYVRAYGEDRIGGINLVAAISMLGTERALSVITPEFLALVPGFFSNDAMESIGALEALLRMVFSEVPAPVDYYAMLGFNAIVPPHVREALFSRSLENDDVLSRLRTPVLITHGQDDAIVRPAAAEQHAAAIPHARLSLYPSVGHAPFWEDAARFNRELRGLVGRSRNRPGQDPRTPIGNSESEQEPGSSGSGEACDGARAAGQRTS
jgi:non-heme chloroperoxidase